MDPILMAGIGAGANLLGGVLGEWWASADEEERARLEQLAMDEHGNLSVPKLQQIVAQQVQGTALDEMRGDYGNKGARNAAIQALMKEGLSGGNSLESQLAQANAQRTAGQAYRQGSGAALQSAARRGMGGAASTLQAQLLGASTGADRAAQVGLEGAANARRQALQALQAGGSMAGQAEASDTGFDLQRLSARDRINMFNAGQRSETDRFNTGLTQQDYENRLGLADRRAGGLQRRAEQRGRDADRKRRMAGGLGQAAGYAGTAAGTHWRP